MFYLAKATHVQRRTRVSLVTSIGAIRSSHEHLALEGWHVGCVARGINGAARAGRSVLLPLGEVSGRVERLLLLELLFALTRRREASTRVSHLTIRMLRLMHVHLSQLRHASRRILAQLFLHMAVA